MPTLIAAYPLYANANDASTLTTPSFTPTNGEVLVIKGTTWDTGTSMGTPTGGSQTYTARQLVAPGGFSAWCGLYTTVIAGSPGLMAVSSTPTATCWHSLVVERWGGAQLAQTPAINTGATAGNGTAPSGAVTTTAADSVVSWVCADVNSRDPAGRAYLSGAVEDGLQNGFSSSSGVYYHAYQSAAAAGAQTVGMSAPSTQRWVLAAVEVQAAAAAAPPLFTGWGVPI